MVRLGLGSDLYNEEMWDNLLLNDPRLEKLSINLKNFYDGKRGAASLIAFDDNLLFIWDNQSQQFYCLIMKDFQLVNVQHLIPTNAPLFDVDLVIMSPDGRYIALQGPRGLNIMELPRKFGPLNAYEGGKASILCRTVCLAERFFICNQQVTVAESRWHPGSPAGSAHLSVLTNDDCIRIYDVSVPQICFQEIKLGDPTSGDNRNLTSKFASSLGQTAVSFDFGLAVDKRSFQGHNFLNTTTSEEDSNVNHSTLIEEDSCIWPIYVLRGNGDVLLVYNDLHNLYVSKQILGPLTMRPPAEDNYGVDASSIICLECAPTLLAIATSSGMIYHCLALDNADSGTDVYPPTLFVVESIELVYSLTSVTDHDSTTTLRLIKPSVNPQIYFCSHEAGIHIVNVPFLKLFGSSQFVSLDDQQSIVEHLICTKPISSSTTVVPSCIPLGVALVARRGFYSVGILLSSGEILTQRLSSINFKYYGQTNESELKASLEDPVSFTIYINQILKRSINAPHIKSEPNKEPNKADCLKLLLNTTDILKTEYIARMEKAAATLVKRASSLVANKNLELEDIEKLSFAKDSIISAINQTSVKFDQTLERQEKLSQRVEKILETCQTRQNHLSEAERSCQKELNEMASTINSYRNRLDQVQLKNKYQNELKDRDDPEGKGHKKRQALIAHQTAAVKKILTSQSEAIQQLVNQVNALHKHFNQIKLLT